MKIKTLNNVNSLIVYETKRIAMEKLENTKITVGLFQSTKYEGIKWFKKGRFVNFPGAFVVKEDFYLESRVFPEISEMEDFFGEKLSSIVWVGKVIKRDKDNRGPRHIVGHELKHAEQLKTDSKSFYKNKLLDFFLPCKKIPSEIDADKFADEICGRGNKKDYEEYDWVEDTNELFNEYKETIEIISREITENKNEIVINIGGKEYLFDDVPKNMYKRPLFQYLFQKAVIKIKL